MEGKMLEKVNFLNPQMKGIISHQGMLPPKNIRSSINLDTLDLMFQKLQMSSKVYKTNKIEDKVQLKETFQPKVIRFNSGQECFMGLKLNRPFIIKNNLKTVIKPNTQKQTAITPVQKTKINSSAGSNTTIKIPKMNLFKTTTPIAEPNPPQNEDKKKRIIIIYLINHFFIYLK